MQNRNRLKDMENKLVFTRGEREKGGRESWGYRNKRYKVLCIK